MKVELKEIVNQLSEAIDLDSEHKVAALIDNDEIVGWNIVRVYEDGEIVPVDKKIYKNISELVHAYIL